MNSQFLRAISFVALLAFLVFTNAPAALADHKWQYVGNLSQRKGESVYSLAVSPSGSIIAVSYATFGANNPHVDLFASDSTFLRRVELPGGQTYVDFRDLEFSPDGSLLYGWYPRYVFVWRVSDGKYLGKYGDGTYGGVGFGINKSNPDSNTYGGSSSSSSTALPPLLAHAGGGTKTNIHIRDAKNIKIGTAQTSSKPILDIDYANSGGFFAAGGSDGYAYTITPPRAGSVWQTKQLKPAVGSTIWSVDVDPTDKWIAAGGVPKTVMVWDNKGTVKKLEKDGHKAVVQHVLFSSYSNYLVTGSSDGTAKIWRMQDWGLEDTLPHGTGVTAVGMSSERDMTTVYTGGGDGIVKIWRKAGSTPAPSSSPTPTPSKMPTPNPTPSSTPNPTPTSTILPTPTPTPSITIDPTPTPTPTPTITISPTPTPTILISPTPGPTLTPTPSAPPTI